MKQTSRNIAAVAARQLARRPVTTLLSHVGRSRRNVLRVLTYHRVCWPDERRDLCPSTLSATPADFAAQMECIRDLFNVVDLRQVLFAQAGEHQLPPGAVLITFDDAYLDFQEHAWPILQGLELPATMFVATAYADDPARSFWWDRLHQIVSAAPVKRKIETRFGPLTIRTPDERRQVASRMARRLSELAHDEALAELARLAEMLDTPAAPPAVLDWKQLRRLSDGGLTLAPHTRTHPLMNRIALQQAREEARASRDDLSRRIGHSPAAFAFPGGAHNRNLIRMLREEGFELAFTTCRGANHLRRCDPLKLRRINVGRNTSAELLKAQLMLPPTVLNGLCRFRGY